jgi:hypothetical protein
MIVKQREPPLHIVSMPHQECVFSEEDMSSWEYISKTSQLIAWRPPLTLTFSIYLLRYLEEARHHSTRTRIGVSSPPLGNADSTNVHIRSKVHRFVAYQVHAVYLLTHRLWETPEIRHRRVLLMGPCNDDHGFIWCSGDDVSLLFRR